ncbi:hypothetical protein ACA910_014410 [Epithemia clementina (nom. ined.)]
MWNNLSATKGKLGEVKNHLEKQLGEVKKASHLILHLFFKLKIQEGAWRRFLEERQDEKSMAHLIPSDSSCSLEG